MSSQLAQLPVRYGGGLNLVDAPDALGPGEASVFRNFRITGRGWLTSRKAAVELSTPTGDIIGVIPYNHTGSVGAALLVHNSGSSSVELYTVDGSGGSASLVGTLAGYGSGITGRIKLTGAVLGRVLFICDVEKTYGLTCYDPNDVLGSGATGGLFQPTFDFDDNAAYSAALPAIVVEHLNHLWMFGYGDEADPNRPELGRFSFLGLLDDGLGTGDAGSGGAAGSADLFDRGDSVPISAKGEAVVSAASTAGRLVVCTDRRAFAIYGSGRDSWRKDQIDGQRGSVAALGMVEADGIAYWLSPLGPCRYRGGGVVEDLSRKIDPLMRDIDFSSVFGAVHPQENHVRWYYRLRSDTTAGADRWFGWDYLNNAFVADSLPYRVFSAGSVRPSGAEGPTGAPSSLSVTDISDFTARATWENGDTSPGTRTRIYRAPDSGGAAGTYQLIDVVDSGVGQYVLTGLDPVTDYWTKVEHVRNGQVSSSVEASFTTLTTGTLPVPTDLTLANDPILDGGRFVPSILIGWNYADVEGGLKFYVERNSGAGYSVIEETAFGVAYFRDNDVVAGTNYSYRVSAEDQDGNTSGYSSIESLTPDVDDPYEEWERGTLE